MTFWAISKNGSFKKKTAVSTFGKIGLLFIPTTGRTVLQIIQSTELGILTEFWVVRVSSR